MVNTGEVKQKIKLRGVKVPRIVVYLLGILDARKGRIKKDENGNVQSAYLQRKSKDYASYSAKLCDITKNVNSEDVQKIISYTTELEMSEKSGHTREDVCESGNSKLSKNQCRKRRRQEIADRKAADRKKRIVTEMGTLIENINRSEHETEQMLMDARSQLESVMTVYLQGAGKYMDLSDVKEELLSCSTEAEDIYRKHCRLTEQMKDKLLTEQSEEKGE